MRRKKMAANPKRTGTVHEGEHYYAFSCYAPPRCKKLDYKFPFSKKVAARLHGELRDK